MLNYFLIVSTFAFWQILLISLSKFTDHTLSKNIVHCIHALLYVIMYSSNNDKYYLINMTTSFYLYDLIYIVIQLVRQKVEFNAQGPYIIHHFIAIYGLYLSSMNNSSEFILMVYYILENSNFMLYLAYHVNKTHNKSSNIIKVIEFIQYIWYTYFRVVYFSRYLIQSREVIYSHNMILSYFLLAALYMMGVYWSYKLFIKNIKNITLFIEEIKPKNE